MNITLAHARTPVRGALEFGTEGTLPGGVGVGVGAAAGLVAETGAED
jgi:hypothetical protein